MLRMQKSSLCKLGLDGDKCGGNFNKFNIFIKSSSSRTYVGESSKPKGAQIRNTRTLKDIVLRDQPSRDVKTQAQ